jgi:hypothetical protein
LLKSSNLSKHAMFASTQIQAKLKTSPPFFEDAHAA